VTGGTTATVPVQRETRTIPIVFASVAILRALRSVIESRFDELLARLEKE
jgi:hypothetical protein